METFHALNTHLAAVRADFLQNVTSLSRTISDTARPMSSVSSFHAYSNSSNPAVVNVHTPPTLALTSSKSDLYSWRQIFQLYVDTEVFESRSERTRGERSIEDAEERLNVFVQRMTERGFMSGHALKLKESRQALETFLQLNSFILDLKKVRVSLPFPSYGSFTFATPVPVCDLGGDKKDPEETCEAHSVTYVS